MSAHDRTQLLEEAYEMMLVKYVLDDEGQYIPDNEQQQATLFKILQLIPADYITTYIINQIEEDTLPDGHGKKIYDALA